MLGASTSQIGGLAMGRKQRYTKAEIAMYRRHDLRVELAEHAERVRQLEQELASLHSEQAAFWGNLSEQQRDELNRFIWRRDRQSAVSREIDSHLCHLPPDAVQAHVADHFKGDAHGVVSAARTVLHDRAVRAMLATRRGILSPEAFDDRRFAFALWGFCAVYFGSFGALMMFTDLLHSSFWGLAAVFLCALPGALGALTAIAIANRLFIEDAGIKDDNKEAEIDELLYRIFPHGLLALPAKRSAA